MGAYATGLWCLSLSQAVTAHCFGSAVPNGVAAGAGRAAWLPHCHAVGCGEAMEWEGGGTTFHSSPAVPRTQTEVNHTAPTADVAPPPAVATALTT